MIRELDSRTNAHGDRIRLLWLSGSGEVAIEIAQGASGVVHRAPVAAGSALDAFQHPYVYVDATAVAA
jgi:hypothetical protein